MAESQPAAHIHSSEKLFECPVCYTVFKTFIYMCKKGHNICGECKKRVENCPVCRSAYEGARNFALEELVSSGMKYSCKNEHNGCKEVLPLARMQKHQPNCLHRLYKCFVPDTCEWTGRCEALKNHIKLQHSSSVSTTNGVLLIDRMFSSKTVGHSEYFFVQQEGELFVHYYKREPEKGLLFTACYIGDAEKASKYKFKLNFEDEYKTKKMTIRSEMKPDSQTELTEETSIFIDYKTAKQFQRYNGVLQYLFSILKGR